MSYQKLTLIGRLGAEPETRAFPNGGSICNLRIATTSNWKDRHTGERKEHTEWHRVVLRNRLGEIAQQYLHKGSQVMVTGELRTRKWQNRDGADRYTTEVIGDEMVMLDSRPSDGSMQSYAHGQQYNAGQEQAAGETRDPATAEGDDYYDDDYPF